MKFAAEPRRGNLTKAVTSVLSHRVSYRYTFIQFMVCIFASLVPSFSSSLQSVTLHTTLGELKVNFITRFTRVTVTLNTAS